MIETQSARIAIMRATMLGHESRGEHDQAIYGYRIQRSPSSSTAGAIAHGICAGEILAEVDRQREPVRSWLYVAYAEPPWEWISYDMLQTVQLELRGQWRERCGARIDGWREAALLRTAIEEKRATLNNPRSGFRPGDWVEALSIPRESWSRRYRGYAKAAQDIIDDWDKEGRGAVAARLNQVCAA